MSRAAELAERHGLRRVPGRAEWRGECPSCGYVAGLVVKEREGRALWWCASCGDDRSALTAAVLSQVAPAVPGGTQGCRANDAARTAHALGIWNSASPLRGSPAEHYLNVRGVLEARTAFPTPPEGVPLRYLARCRHPTVDRLPALVALVRRTSDGGPVAVHRTYLAAGGGAKAAVEPPRASKGPVKGGAIMLHAPDTEAGLAVAEGLETALAASALLGTPAWACVSAGGLAAFTPSHGTARLTIAADPDEPGQRAAWACARRLRAAGLRVRVATPDDTASDFNDLLRDRQQAAEAAHA